MRDQSDSFRTEVRDFSQNLTLSDQGSRNGAFPFITEVFDNAGQQQGALDSGDITDARQPVISGRGIAGTVIVIDIRPGSGLQFVTVDRDGNWTYTPNTPLADGTHLISVYQQGAPGIRDTFILNVNQEGFSRPVVNGAFDDAGDVTGLLPSGSSTDDRRPTFTGSGATPNGVLRAGFGPHVFEIRADADGHWSWTPPIDMTDGVHFVTFRDLSSGTFSDVFTLTVGAVTPAPVTPTIDLAFDNAGASQGGIANGSSTDDTRPTLRGSAAPNEQVSIYDNGFLVATVMTDRFGQWSWESAIDLAAGPHNFQVRSGDQASNTFTLNLEPAAPEAPAIQSAFDNVGPEQGGLFSGAVTDDMRPTLRGSAAPNTQVSIYDNGVLIATVTADQNGRWNWESPTDLAEGSHSFQVRAGDQTSDSFVLILEPAQAQPVTPVIHSVLDNVGDSIGALAYGSTTDDMRPTLRGTAAPYAVVSIYDNGVLVATVKADYYGQWQWESPTDLAAGPHSFQVSAGDQTSQAFALTLQPASQPQLPSILSALDDVGSEQGELSNGGVTDDARPRLSGTGEPGSYVHIYDNGRLLGYTMVDAQGRWTYTPDGLADGDHTFTAITAKGSSDAFTLTIQGGGYSDKPIFQSVMDNAGSAQGELANSDRTDDTTPTFSGLAKPGSWVTIRDGGIIIGQVQAGENGHWSFTPRAELTAGEHTFQISNEYGQSWFQLTIAPPVASIVSVLDDVGNEQGQLASGATTDDNRPTLTGMGAPNGYVFLYDHGQLMAQVFTDAQGRWTYTPDALSDGQHAFTVKNQHGSSETFSLNVQGGDNGGGVEDAPKIVSVIDNVGPEQGELANGATTDDYTPTLIGTTRPGALVAIHAYGYQIAVVRADEHGNWTYTLENDFPGQVTITASNSFGESSFDIVFANKEGHAAITSVFDNTGAQQGALANGTTTDDSTPTLVGMAKPGAPVIIRANGQVIGQAFVEADGSWTFTPSALPPGHYTFTASNPLGETSFQLTIEAGETPKPAAIDQIFDDAGAEQGALGFGATTDDARPTLSGSGTPFTTVTIYDNGAAIGQAFVGQDGRWSWEPAADLINGQHNFRVAAPGELPSEAFTVNVLAQAAGDRPQIAFGIDNAGNEEGLLFNGGVTDDRTPDLSGQATPGITLTIYLNGVAIDTVGVDGGGNWRWIVTSDLPPGDHVFTVAGPKGVHSEPFELKILPPAPEVLSMYDDVGAQQGEFTDGSAGTVTDDARPRFSGTGEPGSTIYIYDVHNTSGTGGTLLGSVEVGADGRWTFTPDQGLLDGIHLISSSYTADGQNQGTPIAIQVDTTGTIAPQAHADAGNESAQGDIDALSLGDVLADEGPALFSAHDAAGEVVTDIAAQLANVDIGLGDVTSAGIDGLAAAHATAASDLLSQWEVVHPTVH
ncbi:Ig-like domain-containing protein [Dyella sp. BiH032]|uniref:Ig-like domain-containing protein n=1 Tax=Dyella sp. BiH032 TaxID=3075430 RepID=UPI002893174A|nr:Ig-like domain-containing protein [Dyella sp. BiH032]WNL45392.1 Ig-like domain-containing protein [Dyella sp. BiH032]